AYAAVSPQDGRMDSLVLPEVSSKCMQIFLNEVAQRYPDENILMIMDGAGWHKSHHLQLPENLRLLFLPPYSPELNPQEHLWDELREKYFTTGPLTVWRRWKTSLLSVYVSLRKTILA
uniref:transposase n=1 Tax=Acidithiobacillus thiooxidans TaxID=930 RepID=UPI00187264F1